MFHISTASRLPNLLLSAMFHKYCSSLYTPSCRVDLILAMQSLVLLPRLVAVQWAAPLFFGWLDLLVPPLNILCACSRFLFLSFLSIYFSFLAAFLLCFDSAPPLLLNMTAPPTVSS
jgi:hypothetical protein